MTIIKQYQKSLVSYLNTVKGRMVFEISNEWNKYKAVQVGTNHITFQKEIKNLLASFG